MLVEEAKKLVLSACEEVTQSGLIVKTFGNISCRIDKKTFAITPKGKDYKDITSEDIVVVNIDNLSYEGIIKPSSEIAIHKEAYRLRPDINFIIHTHQLYASILSAAKEEVTIPSAAARSSIGNKLICANYALPGSKALGREFKKALLGSNNNAILLANHGTICMGTSCNHALKVSYDLENWCDEYIKSSYNEALNSNNYSDLDLIVHSISSANLPNKNLENVCYISFEELNLISKEILASKPAVKSVKINKAPGIKIVSKISTRLLPLFDDFASVVGTSIQVVSWNNEDVVGSIKNIKAALKNKNALLIDGFGALCCGASETEAEAISAITEKQCNAYLYGLITENLNPINKLYCKIIRYKYIKYSK